MSWKYTLSVLYVQKIEQDFILKKKKKLKNPPK